jgi:uncharacterized protein YndB with AHSA1/START domain
VSATSDIAASPELTVTRLIDAPRPLVFSAWTDPAQIERWWGPRGFVTISHQMDVRPGGAYRFGMRSPQGTEHWKRGVYREIVAPERIVFTYAWIGEDGRPGHETLVTVTFEAVSAKTRLTLHQAAFETIAARDDHTEGWTSCLERFAEYMTSSV